MRLASEPRAELVRASVVDGARMNASIPGSGGSIEEVFWKAGDLADEELVIACPGVEAPSAAQLAFVRLVPMSGQEVAEYTGSGSDPATKLIIAQLDGHSGSSFFDGARTVDDLLSIYAPLADSDVGTLFLGTGGTGAGSTFYPSAVGTPYGEGEEAFVSERAARTVRSLRGFLERGIDPVRLRVDFVQAMGIDVFLGFRMGTMAGPPPDYTHSVPFWREHPELRCRDSDGRTVARLSMAYPEVRRFYVDLLLELAAYGVEGVQLIYTRRAPFVLYEPPVIEAFRAAHGVDPRELRGGVDHRGGDPQWQLEYGHDERLMDLWAGYVTTFMRELREALDASGAGRRVRVAANVWPDDDTNCASGLDLRTWAREGWWTSWRRRPATPSTAVWSSPTCAASWRGRDACSTRTCTRATWLPATTCGAPRRRTPGERPGCRCGTATGASSPAASGTRSAASATATTCSGWPPSRASRSCTGCSWSTAGTPRITRSLDAVQSDAGQ